jgi:aminopeptidase N
MLLQAGLAAVVALGAGAASARAADYTPGAPGTGDPLYPLEGNGGYDVGHYNLRVTYDPATQHLDGVTTITARATQNLSQFDLDLLGFDVSAVTVNDKPASFTRDGQELVITPSHGILSGHGMHVTVAYAGTVAPKTDPDGSLDGFIPTSDGAFVASEPQGSPTWYAVNDTPADKATFRIEVTVPTGTWALSNGVLASHTTDAGWDTFAWRERDPMSPYLATATIGQFDVQISSMPGGIRVYRAVDPTLGPVPVLDKVPEMIEFFETLYGPYPFDATGAIVDDADFVGYALETQTKPLFDRIPGEETLAHELSHQWFGDDVTLATWPNIWLHEGFATWSQWAWTAHEGGEALEARFQRLYDLFPADSTFWQFPIGAPPEPAALFDGRIYNRGAMTLEALREKIGNEAFLQALRDYLAAHAGGNATTADFIAAAEHASGQDLTSFFDVWLVQQVKPTSW